MGDTKKSSISKRSSCYLLNLKQPDRTGRRLKLTFQRTAASISILKADRNVEASVGFLDVSETGAGVFTPELLNKGTWVELCITEPMILKVRGIVAWSMPVTSGVHKGKFKCRSGIHFVYENDAQKEAVKEFIKRASSDPVENFKSSIAANPAAAPAATAGDAPAASPTDAALPDASASAAEGAVSPPVDAAETVDPNAATASPDAPAPAPEAAVPPADGAAPPAADAAPAAESTPPAAEATPPATSGTPENPEGGEQAA